MSTREYIIRELNTLPEAALDKVQEFIMFQKFSFDIFEDDTDYLTSVSGMTESILKGKAEPINECLDSVGWDIS